MKLYSGADLVGYLNAQDGLKNCKVSVELNGSSTLKFDLPFTSSKWTLLEDPNLTIRVDSREYCLLNPLTKERGDVKQGHVEMVESWAELGRIHPTVGTVDYAVTILSGEAGEGGFDAGSAGSALYRLLDRDWTGLTQWTVGTVDVTGTHDLELEKVTLLEAITKVQETWGGWLVWDSVNHTVSLRDDATWQNDTGFELRYTKNEKTLKKIEDFEGIITRLIPFGEKDLDIASVNGGVKYLEDFSYTAKIREGIRHWEEISDPAELKTTATAYLSQVCHPKVQYTGEMLDLRTLSDYSHELLSLGDIVTIQDEELANAVKVRLIGHTYDVIQPWKCSIKLGDPMTPMIDIADSVQVSNWVSEALRPSKGVSRLRQGFINTFMTVINSADGKVEWSDGTLTFIEVDENGDETGKRMRLTSGGLGISTDQGQTYVTAITGDGIFADKIIVSDVYALSSEDTYSKMNGSGFHVYDSSDVERVMLGRWNDGSDHYGVKIWNDKGDVLLDDTGILQTWQDHLVDNVDSTHGLSLNLYLPATTLEIVNANLRIKLANFRAYETGAASGGGSTSGASSASTTPSGGGSTSGSSSASTTASGGGATSGASSSSTTASGGGGTSGSSSVSTTTDGGAHRHIFLDPTGYSPGGEQERQFYARNYSGSQISVVVKTAQIGGATTLYTLGQDVFHNHGMNHTHTLSSHTHEMPHTHTVPSHTHGMEHTHSTPNHSHNIEHTHTIPNHTHNLTFGIYEGTAATGVTVTINGVDRTAALGGPFNADQSGLDIAQYLVVGQWNTILLGSTQLGRIDATVFLQAKMSATA